MCEIQFNSLVIIWINTTVLLKNNEYNVLYYLYTLFVFLLYSLFERPILLIVEMKNVDSYGMTDESISSPTLMYYSANDK